MSHRRIGEAGSASDKDRGRAWCAGRSRDAVHETRGPVNVLDRLKLDVVNCADFAGNRPYAKADSVGARVLLFNPDEDPLVTPALVDEARGWPHHYIVGLRFNCTMQEKPPQFADDRSAIVERLGGKAKIAVVMFDVELDKGQSSAARLAWQAAFLDEWDFVRYGRPTLFNVAAFQDATDNDYQRMLERNVVTGQRLRKIGVQSYQGAELTPVAPRDATGYLSARGIALDDLEPVLDPAHPLAALAGLDCETRGATLFEAGRIP
jgi:hypothetical protein